MKPWPVFAALMNGLDWPRRIMAVLVLAFPLLIVLGRAPADMAASVTALMLLFISLRDRDFAWARQAWLIAGLAVWAYLVTLNAALSIAPERSIGTALVWGRWLLFAAAVQGLLTLRPRLLNLLLGIAAVIVVVVAVDVLLQFVHGADLLGNEPTASGRLTGPFSRPNVGYFLLFIGLPVMVLGMMRAFDTSCSMRTRLAWTAALLLIFTAILFTGERMVLILTVLGLALAAVLLIRPLHRVFLLFAGLAGLGIVLVSAVHWVSFRLVEMTVQQLSQFGETEYARIWAHAWDMFTTFPVFGTGLRTYRLTCALEGGDPEVCGDLHPHQLYLEWLSETGLVGTLGFVALAVFLIRRIREAWPAWQTQPLVAGAVVATLVRLWPITSSSSFFANWNEAIFWFLLGLSVVALAPAKGARTEG